ncbi:uncharacterized protein B0H18DRAFT_974534 [Fomitopsis serialis]|uniref:uncharacterized protein n=1 Tax=Fomitopsis serialis TaxID=139415 RepID=UPI002007BA0B|nr:uncharacterized protein B0H18DRAFT_974534 [Neoantrodia serialis]KAH9936591.1 hypothetical protein B0H18DRAFT_974534 [Neoantrodia serialis]
MAYKPPHARAHRVYKPGKRHMELMPSLSRSSGLDKDGDALRDRAVQEEYRAFIEGKVNEHWKRHPHGASGRDVDATKHRQEEQENILILFRKLREGLLATDRKDAFAVEVYETSLHLSILFRSDKQTTSILSHLLPHLYLARPEVPEFTHGALSTTLLSLFHHLLLGYPSQTRFHEHLHSLPRTFLPRDGAAYRWLAHLTHCLRTSNYAKLQELTDRGAFERFFEASTEASGGRGAPVRTGDHSDKPEGARQRAGPYNLALEAMYTLVEGVRAKARATVWLIMRSAYRELHCLPPPVNSSKTGAEEPSPTSEWLARSLALHSLGSTAADVNEMMQMVDEWLAQKCDQGEVKRKEGAEGRWIVCKVAVKV